MEKMKSWLKKNGVNTLLIILFAIFFISTDAKAWVMRQIASTGLLNSKIENKQPETTAENTTDSAEISFSVKDENGSIINTKDLKGKVVFINFWASWCPPCRAEFPSIQKFYEKYKDNPGIVFITVNLDDDPELGKKYLKKENFTIPFLTPENSYIPQEYFGGSLPTTVILDKSGVKRLTHTGMADYSTQSFFEQIDFLLNE